MRLDRHVAGLPPAGLLARLSAILLIAGTLVFSSAVAADSLQVMLGPDTYQLELATTTAERQQGLMHRQNLAQRQGMLLVYQQPGDHRIWMKNMLIPLRVYWLDASFQVIDMQRLEPCEYSPCPVFSVAQPSRYILELADYDHPLAIGDRLVGVRLE